MNTSDSTGCCPDCHFTFEIVHALPYLPTPGRYWLVADHKRLDDLGHPREDVRQHSRDEMVLFRTYIPRDATAVLPDGSVVNILAQIEADHLRLLGPSQ